MLQTPKVPDWANQGPEDLEYRSYKMLYHASSIRKLLTDGYLWDALQQCDGVLDFLYQYDAERLLTDIQISTKLTRVSWENIEHAYFTGDELATNTVMDQLVAQAIDTYEVLHSQIRESWRKISATMTITHAGNRPDLIGDGFVLVITPNNKVHVYSFNNPSGRLGVDWRQFKLDAVTELDYSPESMLGYIKELKEANRDRIVYKVTIKNETRLEGGAINVISSNIFMQLRKDYGF
jgi:hypothetical protein